MSSSDLLLLCFAWLSSAYTCPDGQIQHFVADSRELRCCYPVQIDTDYEFVPCFKNGTNDGSKKCREGMVQNDATSSEHEPHCYIEEVALGCNSFDTMVITDGAQKKCVCNGENGFCGQNYLICKYIDCPEKKVHQNCSCMTTNQPKSTTSEDRKENTSKSTVASGINKVTTPPFSAEQIQPTSDGKNQDGHNNGTGQHDINKTRSSEEKKSDSDWLPKLGYIGGSVVGAGVVLTVGLILYLKCWRRNGHHKHKNRFIIGLRKYFKKERNEYNIVRETEEDIASQEDSTPTSSSSFSFLNIFDENSAHKRQFKIRENFDTGKDRFLPIAIIEPFRPKREEDNMPAGTPPDSHSPPHDVAITDNLLPDGPSPAASQEEVSFNPHFNDLNSFPELNTESLLQEVGHLRETTEWQVPDTDDIHTILQQSSKHTAQGNGANSMHVEAVDNTVRKEPYISTRANLPSAQVHTKARKQNGVAAVATNSIDNEANSLNNKNSGPEIPALKKTDLNAIVPQIGSSAQGRGVRKNKTNEVSRNEVNMQPEMDSLRDHQSQECQFWDIERTHVKEIVLQRDVPTEYEQSTGVGSSRKDQDCMNKLETKSLGRMKTAKNRKLNFVSKLDAASTSNSGCPSQGKGEDKKQKNGVGAVFLDEAKISHVMPSPLCSSFKAFSFMNRSSSLSMESLLYSNSKTGKHIGPQVETYPTVGRTAHFGREPLQCCQGDSSLGTECMFTDVSGVDDARVPNFTEFFSLHSLKSLVLAEYTLKKYKRSVSCPALHQK